MNKKLLISGIANLIFILGSQFSQAESSTKILKLNEPRYKWAEVPVEFNYPSNGSKPFPVIISIHGSTQDGKKFTGGVGKTDVYTTRLIEAGLQRGYAVIAIDAFYGKKIKPNDKRKFPDANRYARSIRDTLFNYPDLDSRRVFLTGFSYGGHSVLDELYSESSASSWTALAAAEPDCNIFPEPYGLKTPLLISKGEVSHYPPKPCQILGNLFNDEGSSVMVEVIPKANHHFSLNGRSSNGVAFNGCSDDPIIYFGGGLFKTVSGITVTSEEIKRGRCFTNKGGSGKSWDKLDAVIDKTLTFFDENQ